MAAEGRYEEALKTADVVSQAEAHFARANGEYEIKNNTVYFRGRVLRSELNDRVMQMVLQGHDMTVMTRFLERLTANPSSRVQEQLYSFLQTNNLPMLEDGRIMCFKRIRENWRDCHSGKIDNSIGNVISVQRHEVDDDPQRTCSHGLHVCSIQYLAHFIGERLVGVAVDPADVVAIPYDYDNSKVRVCRYEVINELPMEVCTSQVSPWSSVVVDDDGYDPEDVIVNHLDEMDEYDEEEEDAYASELFDEDERTGDLMDKGVYHAHESTAPDGSEASTKQTSGSLLNRLRQWVNG